MPPLNNFSKTTIAVALSQAIAAPATAATLTVNSLEDITADDQFCTLREAIASVNLGVPVLPCGFDVPGMNDEIVFASSISGSGLINLTQGELSITRDLTIRGPADATLTINQNTANSRVIKILYSEVSLNNLAISGGM